MKRLLKRWLRKILLKLLEDKTAEPLVPCMSTSLSDNQVFPQYCLDASNDYRLFNQFRSQREYRRIGEHVKERGGWKALATMRNDPEIMANIESFKENDEWGGPLLTSFPECGDISTTTLRFILRLTEMKHHFGSLDGLNICEIGVGYGGQCRIINALFKPATYCLVDTQPVLALAHRYLGNYILHSTLSFLTMNELPCRQFDLVISNYSFSEMRRPIQDVYLERVIANAKMGYIAYNEITPDHFDSYKADEIAAMIPGAEILLRGTFEQPETCNIVWGAKAGAN